MISLIRSVAWLTERLRSDEAPTPGVGWNDGLELCWLIALLIDGCRRYRQGPVRRRRRRTESAGGARSRNDSNRRSPSAWRSGERPLRCHLTWNWERGYRAEDRLKAIH